MAVQTKSVGSPLITTIVTDNISNTIVETAAAASQKLYFVEVTNPNSVAVYTKIFAANANSATTGQHYIQLYCPANTNCYTYLPKSFTIANGIQFYTSTSAGIGAGQVNPSSDVNVVIGSTPA